MNSLREKLGYRESLKDIGKNLVKLAWLIFTAYQWLIAISIPFIVFFSIIILILPNSNMSPEFPIYNEALYSLKAKIISLSTATLYIGFAFYYVLKIQKLPEPNTRVKCWVLSTYLGVLLLLINMAELSDYRFILNRIHYSETKVYLYDAKTKELLFDNISYSGFWNTPDQILPLKGSEIKLTEKGFCFNLIDVKPEEISISAPGYHPKKVLVGTERGEQTISVYLEKIKLIDPNLPMKP